jgi:hypothetical protein
MKASFREPGKAPFMEPQAFKSHAINLLVGIGAYCCVSAGLNYWMDPWQIYGPSRYSGESRAERITLAHNIRNAPPFDVLLLGSSRVRYLIDNGRQRSPDRLLTEPYFGNQTVFNAALAGSNIYQMRRIFEHALHKHKPKELVLLLDDVMLNSYRPLGSGWHEYNYYGSPSYHNALERALSLVDFAMLKETAAFMLEWIRGNEQLAGEIVSLPDSWGQNIIEFSRRDLYGCYEINAASNGELDQILTLAKSHGVHVTLMVSFIHPALFEYSYRSDDGHSQRLFLSEVRNLARKYQVPAWFFSPYSSLSSGTPHVSYTSPDFEANPDFYDPGHANSKIGHKMLATALKGESNAELVGYRLNESTINDIFASLKRQRERSLREGDIRFTEFVVEHPLVQRQACPTQLVR